MAQTEAIVNILGEYLGHTQKRLQAWQHIFLWTFK